MWRAVLNMLFPADGQPHSILAVTGTNGKTTTRLLTHFLVTLPPITPVGDHLVTRGQYRFSAQMILQDPTVEWLCWNRRGAAFASGLAFDASNVGVVLNVAADHLGGD